MRSRFPRSARLKRRRLIRPLFDRRSAGTISFGVGCIRVLARSVPVDEAGPGATVRAGFAVPKKTGNAVRRNRFRRIMRETWRAARPENGPRGPVLTAMFLLRGAQATSSEVRRDMTAAAARLLAPRIGTEPDNNPALTGCAAPNSKPPLDTQVRG